MSNEDTMTDRPTPPTEGACPECGQTVALDLGITVRHGEPADGYCSGSGLPPA